MAAAEEKEKRSGVLWFGLWFGVFYSRRREISRGLCASFARDVSRAQMYRVVLRSWVGADLTSS